jgi:transcriptional/translational regulatory protein YebC/TACO1
MGKDEPDISELVEKAKIVAEATGRDEQEVLADLLDDGIVNLSNEESKGKDLVTQLKEAAELITTVQSINKEVSENKVLNGGENSTEVKVETTL